MNEGTIGPDLLQQSVEGRWEDAGANLRDYYKNQSKRLELTKKQNKTPEEVKELEKIRPLAQGLVNRTRNEADYLEKNMTFEQEQLMPIVRSSFLG